MLLALHRKFLVLFYFQTFSSNKKKGTAGLNEEKKKALYDLLIHQATAFIDGRGCSKVSSQELRALIELLEVTYSVAVGALGVG